MRIMTFNLRFENDRDGENGWVYRRRIVVQFIEHYAPSLLGTQEGTPAQLDYLARQLEGYRMLAGHRPADDGTCQYPTLFYRKDAFRSIESGEFWLSLTPEIHRSKSWDSAFPRMMSYGIVEDLGCNRQLVVIVTHLDHLVLDARIEQARLIRNWRNGRGLPSVLLGDFNDQPGSTVHQLLADGPGVWRDTWETLGRGEGPESMTHHDFHGNSWKFRMDWILITPDFRVRDAFIVRDHVNGRYPSDHFPYTVDLDWL
jgi:endonuclease/exonuclease/phosphatase family metal-dependent hydrolase